MDIEQIAVNSNASIFRNINPETNKFVFHPSSIEGVKTSIAKAKNHNLPIVPKGGGTSLSGACTGGNFDKVIITTRSLKSIHEINLKRHTATVDSGVTPVELNKHLAPKNFKFFVYKSNIINIFCNAFWNYLNYNYILKLLSILIRQFFIDKCFIFF